MNCAPSSRSTRSSPSPVLSINVTSFRSTMQARFLSVWWFLFQLVLSSRTQTPLRRPSRIHFSSTGVSLKLIFNMLFSSQTGSVAERLRDVPGDTCPGLPSGLHIRSQFLAEFPLPTKDAPFDGRDREPHAASRLARRQLTKFAQHDCCAQPRAQIPDCLRQNPL